MKFNIRKEDITDNFEELNNKELAQQTFEGEETEDINITNEENPQEINEVTEIKNEDTLDNLKEQSTGPEQEEQPKQPPVDSKVSITVSSDKLTAYIHISPPENGGEEISVPMIIAALKEHKIKHGIKKDLIFKIPLEKAYNEKKIIAEGTPAVNGLNGKINHLYDLEHKNQPKVNKDGCVDFKDTGLITNILKDNVICEIVKPVDPVDGTDVYGQPVKGQKAPELKIPKGNNTYVSDDGLSLCAQNKGNLRLENDLYIVDEVIIINGDVDISTGDIDFVGKVEVRGNILEGYSVKCVGDITVSGMVEGATIETKGNAEIRGGITGMDCAKIQCKGDLKTKFIESATVIVNGNIDTDYILNSNVSCNGELKAMGRKGVIIGGNCTALQLIETKSIGNDNGSKTNVTVGITTEIIEKRKHLIAELSNCEEEQNKHIKDLQYLTFKMQMGDLSPDRQRLLKCIKARLPLLGAKKKMLIAEQNKIQDILDEGQKSKIVCHGDVFSGVVISIASSSMNISHAIPRGTFMLIDGEIKIMQ